MSTLLKSFLLKTFLPIFRQLQQTLSIQLYSQLQPFIPGNFCAAVSLSFDHRVMSDNLSKLLNPFLLKRQGRTLSSSPSSSSSSSGSWSKLLKSLLLKPFLPIFRQHCQAVSPQVSIPLQPNNQSHIAHSTYQMDKLNLSKLLK